MKASKNFTENEKNTPEFEKTDWEANSKIVVS